VRLLLIGMKQVQERYPVSKLNDGASPEKPGYLNLYLSIRFAV